MNYLVNGEYVSREVYQKHLKAEREKLAKAQEAPKAPAKEGGK